MSPVPGVCSYKIPSFKCRRLQISVTNLWVALAVFAASIALTGRLNVQHDRSATNELLVLVHEHQGLPSGPEDATHLLQAVKPVVEYEAEDKVSSDPQVKVAANLSPSINLFGSIVLAKNAIDSAWISLRSRNTLVTLHRLTSAETVVLVVLTLSCVGFVGVLFTLGMKEALKDPSELTFPLTKPSVDEPAPDMRRRGPATPSTSPAPASFSASFSPDHVNPPQTMDLRTLTQSPSPKPIPRLATIGTMPQFPPHLGIPLREVTAFDVNANHDLIIVNLMHAQTGYGKPVMWARITNSPSRRMLQLFTDMSRLEPRVRVVSIPRRGAFEINAGGTSYGFLEAESSGRCCIVHNGEHVMFVEGHGSTKVPEIAVRSKREQVAGLRCNQALGEPYMEFGISPGEDTLLIVAAVLAVMLLAPATWRP